MLKLFEEIEMPLVETLASMEHTGMYIDKKKIDEFDSEISCQLQDIERKIGITFIIIIYKHSTPTRHYKSSII